MSLNDKIIKLIDEELECRVNAILNEFAVIISKKHAISLELLLKDIPATYTSTICKGTKSDGHRCTFRSMNNGYCRKHREQGEKICQRNISSLNLHTHGPEQMYVKGCPGCESTNNGLIDLGI